MKRLESLEMEGVIGGQKSMVKVTLGCAAIGTAAMWTSVAMGPAALGIGTLTYVGCLLLES